MRRIFDNSRSLAPLFPRDLTRMPSSAPVWHGGVLSSSHPQPREHLHSGKTRQSVLVGASYRHVDDETFCPSIGKVGEQHDRDADRGHESGPRIHNFCTFADQQFFSLPLQPRVRQQAANTCQPSLSPPLSPSPFPLTELSTHPP